MVNKNCLPHLNGSVLVYPCSAGDWLNAVNFFSKHINHFYFCDHSYKGGKSRHILNGIRQLERSGNYSLLEKTRLYYPEPDEYHRKNEHPGYRVIWPEKYRYTYLHIPTNRRIIIDFKYGSGHYSIYEFEDKSIGVFMHRGDSLGCGGSFVFFLTDKKMRHEPLSRYFFKLSRKLIDKPLIVSDGSNCNVSQLRKYYMKEEKKGSDVYTDMEQFSRYGYQWSCAGYMNNRYHYGPTFIWSLTKAS